MQLGNGVNNFLFNVPSSSDPLAPNILVGLPATGFWAANYVNANAQPGLLANYSGLHKHRGDREAVAGDVFQGVDGFEFTEFVGSAP
jgi:hypothetical protein